MTFDAQHVRAQMEARSDEELIEILAGRADQEWEPEAYALVEQILEARGVSPERLIESTPQQLDEGDEGVVLEQFVLLPDAHQCRMVLEAAGIECWMGDEFLTGAHFQLGIAIGGVKVFVRRRDVDAAREILRAVPVAVAADPREPAADFSQPCRRCGASVTPGARATDRADTLTTALLLGNAVAQRSARYTCGACGHTWTE